MAAFPDPPSECSGLKLKKVSRFEPGVSGSGCVVRCDNRATCASSSAIRLRSAAVSSARGRRREAEEPAWLFVRDPATSEAPAVWRGEERISLFSVAAEFFRAIPGATLVAGGRLIQNAEITQPITRQAAAAQALFSQPHPDGRGAIR